MPPREPRSTRTGDAPAWVLWVFSLVALGMACSVDTAKLRARRAPDDAGASDGRAGLLEDAVVGDVVFAPLDAPGDREQAGPDQGSEDLPQPWPDASDDLPSQVGPDASSDDLPRVGPDLQATDAWTTMQDVPIGGDVSYDVVGGVETSATGDEVGLGEDARAEPDVGVGDSRGAGGTDGNQRGTGGSGGTTGTGGRTGTGGASDDPDLVLWYKFDESSGNLAADSSSSGLDGKLAVSGASGSAMFSTDSKVGTHALRLTPESGGYGSSGGYVTTPAPTSLAPNAITIALWVKLASAASDQAWARLFDFGTGPGASDPYFYMTPRASDTSSPRFGITNVGRGVGSVQRLDGPSPLSANEWHHIAIVLPAGTTYTGSLYIDGAVVATNNAMTVHPADVGVTTENWLGRSPNSGDPFLSGWLDDFRIYKRALSAAEIAQLMALR